MSEPTPYRIAAVQTNPQIGAVSHNRETLLERLGESARHGARLVVFPECALTGYGFESRAEAIECSEPIDGPSARAITEKCRSLGVWTIYGFLESDGETLFNACALIGPDGPVATYRKVHLPYIGVDRFADPGDRPFAVHDAGGVEALAFTFATIW